MSREKDGGTSPELQRHAIQGYADSHGIRIVDWVEGVDEAKYSGSSAKSKWWPKLDAAIDRMESGEINTIVVWKFSRTARNRLKWAVAIDRVDGLGGEMLSATEPVETTTAAGKLHRGMMAEFNAYYADMMSESWKETHMRRRRAGLPATGVERYGYDKQEDGTYVPNETQGPILAEMYRRYLAWRSFRAVATWLQDQGHVTNRGNLWERTAVTQLLDSGFGAGKLIHRGTVKGNGHRSKRMEDATYDEGAHEPVITAEEWDAYRALRLAAPEPPRVIEAKYLLSGLMRCGDCGGPMHSAGNIDVYRCSRSLEKRDIKGVAIKREFVERELREWISEQAADVDAIAAQVAERYERKVVQMDTTRSLEKKRAAIVEQMGKITVRWSAGKMPDAAYEAATTQLEEDLSGIIKRLSTAAPEPVRIDPTKLLLDLDQDWDDLTHEERRGMIRSLVKAVHIDPAPHRGRWFNAADRVRITPAWVD